MKCYDSCPHCDADSSCDWTSCHDDLAYTRAVVEAVAAAWCLDLDSLHMSGMSNGGMFSYYAMSRSQLCLRVNIDQGIIKSTLRPHVELILSRQNMVM